MRRTATCAFSLTLLLAACTHQPERATTNTPLQGNTFALKSTEANGYVEAGLRGLNLPQLARLSLDTTDLTRINFSNTQIAQLPFADKFLNTEGYIRPDRIPQVNVVEAQSMVELTDENLAYYAALYNASFPQDIPYAAEAFKLNFTDKFVYSIEIPDVGYVGYADVSAQYVKNSINQQDVYYDSPVLYYLDHPTMVSELAQLPNLRLSSLPRVMQKSALSSTAQRSGKLYWFPDTQGGRNHYVVQSGAQTFSDIFTRQHFAFKPQTVAALESRKQAILHFGGQTGQMVETR